MMTVTADFLCDTLPACSPDWFMPFAHSLCLVLVTGSRQFPLVSSHYSLLTVAVKLAEQGGAFSERDSGCMDGASASDGDTELVQLLRDFLQELLLSSRRFQVGYTVLAHGRFWLMLPRRVRVLAQS